MPFEAGLSRPWFRKGVAAGRSGRWADMYAAWHSAKGKPKTSGGRVTAQESFYQGYFDGQDSRKNSGRKRNPTKAQKRAKARTAAKKRGLVQAVHALVKKLNPTAAISGARVVKLKGGGLTIRPIKSARRRR